MDDREGRITDAYDKTFQWIFADQDAHEQSWSNFRDWLESDKQLYWITGKAGSGKSTLMKFICHKESSTISSNPLDVVTGSPSKNGNLHSDGSTGIISKRQSRCEQYLKSWAVSSRLITATYFFWNSGIHLQMSKEGLLRSLLFRILRQCPELIPSVSPSRWEALCLFNDDPREWSKHELEQMLRSAVEKISQDAKLCLFVDGLDEFDGRHDDLICLFQALIANQNVKVCVSSRPWVLFEDAFKHGPSLTLQDLTYPDIKHYVTLNFHRNSGFAQLRSREPAYADQLVENVVSKASGVFLWVHLVVDSLLAGMGYGDRLSDLQRRLDLLPDRLEDLYEKILQSLDPFYLEHAAQLFKLVQENVDPPALLLLSFADEEGSEFALKQPIQPLSPEKMVLRAETMRRRLNSRCKGLLEVGKPSTHFAETGEDTVQYLHRTVKDYVQSPKEQDKLQSAMKSAFDPHLRLCAGNVAHCKAINGSVDFLADGTLWARVQRCLYSASRIQLSNRGEIVPLLDELDRIGTVLSRTMSKNQQSWSLLETGRDDFTNELLAVGQWVPSHPLVPNSKFQNQFGCIFLSLAVRYGVVEYVQAKVNKGCLAQQIHNKVWPLLRDATWVNARWKNECRDTVPSIDMIACLLDRGADPNFQLPGNDDAIPRSVWAQTLEFVYKNFDNARIEPPWDAIVRLMIKHGAEVNIDALRPLAATLGWRSLSSLSQIEPFSTGWGMVKFYEYLLAIKKSTPKSKASWLRWNV